MSKSKQVEVISLNPGYQEPGSGFQVHEMGKADYLLIVLIFKADFPVITLFPWIPGISLPHSLPAISGD